MLSDAISAYSVTSSKAGSDGLPSDHGSDEAQDPDDNHRWTVVGMATVCVLTHFSTAFNTIEGPPNQGWLGRVFDNVFSYSAFITEEDRNTFIFTTVYILYYCVRVEVRKQQII